MAVTLYLIFWLSLTIYACNAYKALVVTQMPSRSHAILNSGIVKQLLKDGNEIYIISCENFNNLASSLVTDRGTDGQRSLSYYIRSIEYQNAPSTLRQIDVSSNEEALPPDAINIKAIMNNPIDTNDLEYVKRMMINVGIKTVENKDVQKLLSDPNEYFDVVIVEFMENDILASLAAVFNCPLIWMSPMEVNSDIISRIDAIPNPAHVPTCHSRNMAPFSFMQRVEELWHRIKSLFLDYWYFYDLQNDVYNRLIVPHIVRRGRKPPSFNDVRYNASLVLGYSHVSMGEAFNLPQSYKPVGGYHIDEVIQPLPEDLKKIMDNAKNGVIYFSMGSNLKSTDFPEDIKQGILRMLGGLQQTVLWKFEEQIPNSYKNVYVSNWFPQMSILSHPNCVVFITHGGLLSTAEALHTGVPVIGIPGFGDQFVNTKRAVHKGFALKVDMTFNIVKHLKAAIDEITSNPSYRQKAKELSFIYRHRPVKPAEELSHWVRHVVETRGASHLRSPAFDVPLYQQLYLDLLALIFIAIILLLKCLRQVWFLVCSKKENKTNVKQKKKKNN